MELNKVLTTLKTHQWKLFKLKSKEKKEWKKKKKTETEYPRTMPQLQRCNTSIMEMPEREGDKRTEEIGAVVMAGNFP